MESLEKRAIDAKSTTQGSRISRAGGLILLLILGVVLGIFVGELLDIPLTEVATQAE